MTLVKVNPKHRRAVRKSSPFNNLLDEFFNTGFDFMGSDFASHAPAVNIKETKDAFSLDLAAPGLNKEDFKINIDKNQLKVSANKEVKSEENKEDGKYTRREFNFNSFSRTFTLPNTIDKKAINAAYENGVLTLTLPKKEEAKDIAREITIA